MAKRTYKHSEAWLAKHANKITATHITDIKRAKKNTDNVKMTKTKKMAKTDKKPGIDLIKQTQKAIDETAKHIKPIKNNLKTLSKIITETLKTGDDKLINRILNKIASKNFASNDNSLTFSLAVKVKTPKIKKTIAPVTEDADANTVIDKQPKRRGRKSKAQKSDVTQNSDIDLTNEQSIMLEPDEFVNAEDNNIDDLTDDEIAAEDIDNGERANDIFAGVDFSPSPDEYDEDEDEDERNQRLEEERLMVENERACRADSDAYIYGAAEDNGDM